MGRTRPDAPSRQAADPPPDRLLSPCSKEVIIGGERSGDLRPVRRPVVPDLLKERCSLDRHPRPAQRGNPPRSSPWPADMPFLHPGLIEKLLEVPGEPDSWCPSPTAPGAAPRALRAVVRRASRTAPTRAWKVTDFYATVRVHRLRVHDAEWLVDGQSPFLNANTPDEWRSAAP